MDVADDANSDLIFSWSDRRQQLVAFNLDYASTIKSIHYLIIFGSIISFEIEVYVFPEPVSGHQVVEE